MNKIIQNCLKAVVRIMRPNWNRTKGMCYCSETTRHCISENVLTIKLRCFFPFYKICLETKENERVLKFFRCLIFTKMLYCLTTVYSLVRICTIQVYNGTDWLITHYNIFCHLPAVQTGVMPEEYTIIIMRILGLLSFQGRQFNPIHIQYVCYFIEKSS